MNARDRASTHESTNTAMTHIFVHVSETQDCLENVMSSVRRARQKARMEVPAGIVSEVQRDGQRCAPRIGMQSERI